MSSWIGDLSSRPGDCSLALPEHGGPAPSPPRTVLSPLRVRWPPTGRCVASICKLRPATRRHVQVPAAPGKRSSSAARASPATALSWLARVSGVGGSHTSTSSPRVPCPRPHGRADGSPGAFRAFVVTSWSPACGSHLTGPPSVPLEALCPQHHWSTELRLRQPWLGLLAQAPCVPRRVPRPQRVSGPSLLVPRAGWVFSAASLTPVPPDRVASLSGAAGHCCRLPPGDHAILRLP